MSEPTTPEAIRWLADEAMRRMAEPGSARALSDGDQPRLNLRTSQHLRERPHVPFLVDGLMPEGALFQMFGETGSYKSFIVLDLAMSIANDVPFMGRKVLAPGAVALILGEGGADAGQRIDAWMHAHPGAADEQVVWSVEEQLDLMSAGDINAIIDDLEEYRADHFPETPWRLIVFDTQADHMPNGDEDRAKDFTIVKRSIQRIAHETGAAVGLVHHTGWDKSRERGSSRQRQALDVVIQVDSMKITNVKQKFAAKFDQITFRTVSSGHSIFVERVEPVAAEASRTFGEQNGTGRSMVLALVAEPGLSTNKLKEKLGIGQDAFVNARDMIEQLGYVELQKNSKGHVVGIEVTDEGRQWAVQAVA